MQAGNLVSSDVSAFTSRVLVGGVERAHESWSISRSLDGDLPAQVVSADGVKQATGTIVWAGQPDVSATASNPWNASAGWLPRSGEPVQILVSDGSTEWVQFTGVIDETSGNVGSPAQSTIVDAIDQLNRPFAFSPLLRIMPPATMGASAYRGIGLTALYLADQAMRSAGFYATPRTESNPALSVPAQTSMWPDRGTDGTLTLGSSFDGISSHALNYAAPWGWSVGNFICTYTPRLSNPGTTPVQMTVMVAPDHSGAMTFDVFYGVTRLRIWITDSRSAVAMLDGVELGRLSLGSESIVTLLVESGRWTLRRSDGQQISGAITMPATAMSSVKLSGDASARVAGFQVSHPSTAAHRFASLAHVASARVEAGYLTGIVDALPAVQTTSRALLDTIGDATLSPYWIDELGVLRAAESWYLRNRTPVQTITTLDDILSLSWSNFLLAARSRVDVSYDLPAVSRARWPNITLYQGSGETMESGQVSETFIEPGSDEAWIQPDTALKVAGVDPAAFNSAHGSFGGGVYRDNTTGVTTSGGAYITAALTHIQASTYKLTHSIGTLPANTKALLKTKDLTTYNPDMRGFNLPVVRGYGKVEWAKATATSSFGGPAAAPALLHDVGPWVSRTDDTIIVQRIADFIGGQTSSPQPVIDGMRVAYDPRRQLGDVIILRSEVLMGVELRCLIVGISNNAGDSFTQSLSVRVISAKSTFTTYDQLAAVWAGGNYASLQAAWAALNYNAMASNPLEVSP